MDYVKNSFMTKKINFLIIIVLFLFSLTIIFYRYGRPVGEPGYLQGKGEKIMGDAMNEVGPKVAETPIEDKIQNNSPDSSLEYDPKVTVEKTTPPEITPLPSMPAFEKRPLFEEPEPYRFVTKWGSKGSGDGQFLSPMAVEADMKGYVYVSDSENHRIQKFDSTGRLVKKLEGLFNWPEGIDVDLDGNLYVADFGNNLVRKFSPEGILLMKIGEGKLLSPGKVAVAPEGNIYVVDSTYKRIQKFSPDGTFILKWRVGQEMGSTINGITADLWENIYVINYLVKSDILKFNSSGELSMTMPLEQQEGHSNYTGGLDTDKNGNIYIADFSNNSIQKLAGDGSLLIKWGKTGTGDGQFKKPADISLDFDGNIYVLDSGNNRVQKFTPNF